MQAKSTLFLATYFERLPTSITIEYPKYIVDYIYQPSNFTEQETDG